MYKAALRQPAPLASIVHTAIEPIRRSVAASELPGLNPNQPNARISVPTATIGMLCAGMALGEPSLLNLPIRGPRTHAPQRAQRPPVMCTTLDPAKSTWPFPSPKLAPRSASQPPPQTQQPKTG